jgi:starch synthase
VRVAFVSFDFGEYCIRIASVLGRDASVLLLVPEYEIGPYIHLLGSGVNIRAFQKPRLRQGLRQLQTVYALVQDIHRFRPDIVHLQAGHLWFNTVLPLLRRYPLVITVHDPASHLGDRVSRKTPQWMLDFAYRRATRLIVHAPQLKQALVDRLCLLENKVDVVPHVAIGEEIAPSVAHQAGPIVLFFGRIWPYKGLEYLIRAEPLVTAQVPTVTFVITGTGEKLDRYRAMMVHPDRFIVHNEYVSDERRAQLFRDATVVALPYIEASQSGVIPLAYRSAKPVVATRVGGLPAIVDDGETGILIPPRDPEVLARALIRVLQNQELARRMGMNGKRKLEKECSPEVVASRTLSIYKEAIEWHRSRRLRHC